MKLTIHSHYFTVTELTPLHMTTCSSFLARYIHYDRTAKKKGEIKKIYGQCIDNSMFKFQIGQLPGFLAHLESNYIFKENLDIEYIPIEKGSSIDITVKPQWELRDFQKEVVEFATKELDEFDYNSRLIELPTGTGKTVCALYCTSIYKKRTLVLILPTYIEKWCSDITEVLEVDPKEVLVLTGSKQIASAIEFSKDDSYKNVKFIILSLATFNTFIKSYEQDPDTFKELYDINTPTEIFKRLDIGLTIIDEIHQHLHIVYRCMLNIHVNKIIALSATFKSDDWFITKIQHTLFPKYIRYDKIKMKKYIEVYPISYTINEIRKYHIRTSAWGRTTYSHVEYEKSIMSNRYLLGKYLYMISDIVDKMFIAKMEKGDKLAIYASTVALCGYLKDYLSSRFTDLDIRTYNQDDPYENVIDSDIRITTIVSAGTGLDIKGLTMVLMTNSISSSVSNLQILGRLRELPNKSVKFVYLYCEQIEKQVDYHRRKVELFRDRAISIKGLKYHNAL